MISAFAQSHPLNSHERPVKRRKVAKSGPHSLAQERGISASGVPLGYIPLARLVLRMVSMQCLSVWRHSI